MPDSELAKHRSALIAQCQPVTRMPEAEAARLPIHVTTWGEAGPTVLIVHGGVQGGLGGGPSTFARQEALADRGWRLAVVDRPGFGRSPSRGVDDMEADAPWIADLLGEGAHLIGHSWGGAEALLAAARRPDTVRSLVLIEPALHSLLMAGPQANADPATRDAGAKFIGLLMGAQSPGDYALGFARALGTATGDPVAPNEAAAALEADPERATRMGCALLQARMASPETLHRAAAVIAEASVPVLVVSGGWSPLYDAVGEIAAKLTGGRHVIVRSPNHFVQSANADDFNATVDAFMREADHLRPGVRKGE